MDWAKRSVQINPDDEFEDPIRAASYAQLGRLELARAAVAEELRIDPDLTLARSEIRTEAPTPTFASAGLVLSARPG